MKHLFIINPTAIGVKGSVNNIVGEIIEFFAEYRHLEYSYHVTRWSRDAVGFIKQFAKTETGILRVYAVGGMGTLFEVVNGAAGLPNIQVAYYPLGRDNSFVHYFGENSLHLFRSLRNLVFSNTISLDLIRCANNYFLGYANIGIESQASATGDEFFPNFPFPSDLRYIISGVYHIIKQKYIGQHYKIKLDDQFLDSEYATMMIANAPFYAKTLAPAVDAHPNDGIFDVYLIGKISRSKGIRIIPRYVTGQYRTIQDNVRHYRGRKMTITSNDDMIITIDGEPFVDSSVQMELIPCGLDFVCPESIDLSLIPKIYQRPKRHRDFIAAKVK